MLKIFVVVMLLVSGASQPIVDRQPVDSYQACVERSLEVKAKAEELNARGGDIAEFKVLVGCEFESTKSDPA